MVLLWCTVHWQYIMLTWDRICSLHRNGKDKMKYFCHVFHHACTSPQHWVTSTQELWIRQQIKIGLAGKSHAAHMDTAHCLAHHVYTEVVWTDEALSLSFLTCASLAPITGTQHNVKCMCLMLFFIFCLYLFGVYGVFCCHCCLLLSEGFFWHINDLTIMLEVGR